MSGSPAVPATDLMADFCNSCYRHILFLICPVDALEKNAHGKDEWLSLIKPEDICKIFSFRCGLGVWVGYADIS